jgi:hypothetical protein
MFESLSHLRELSSEWQDEYNEFHPHQSLNNLSPNKIYKLILKIEKLNLTQFEKWGTYIFTFIESLTLSLIAPFIKGNVCFINNGTTLLNHFIDY